MFTPRTCLFLIGMLYGLNSLASAEPSPSWTYRTPFNEVALPDGATGGFSFPNELFGPLTGDGSVRLSSVNAWSVAPEANPDRVSSLPYRFSVELRDEVSQQTALFGFAGELSGNYWRTGSDLSNRFTGETEQSAELGGREYRVRLTGFSPPTGYGPDATGSIWAVVGVRAAGGGNPPVEPIDPPPAGSVETPEPATLALVAVGLPLALFARRRRHTGRS